MFHESTGAAATPVAAAPAAGPASLTATALQNASAGSIELDWTTVSGADGYLVQSAA